MATVCNTLRRLRDFLRLEQRQRGLLVGRSRHTIESIEQGRLKLSPKLALEISQACGIDSGWLLSNDPSLPMVNRVATLYPTRFRARPGRGFEAAPVLPAHPGDEGRRRIRSTLSVAQGGSEKERRSAVHKTARALRPVRDRALSRAQGRSLFRAPERKRPLERFSFSTWRHGAIQARAQAVCGSNRRAHRLGEND